MGQREISNNMVALIQEISPIIFELIRLNILLKIKDSIEYNRLDKTTISS